MSTIAKLLAVSAVVMGISYTISKEQIFAPLRRRCGGKETFFGYLVSCPYCLSHWVAFLMVPLTGLYLFELAIPEGLLSSVINWFLSAIVVTVVAAFLRVAFFFLDERQGLLRREERHLDHLIEEKEREREEEPPLIQPPGAPLPH